VLKSIIFLLQVGFKIYFVTDCPLNSVQISDHNFNCLSNICCTQSGFPK